MRGPPAPDAIEAAITALSPRSATQLRNWRDKPLGDYLRHIASHTGDRPATLFHDLYWDELLEHTARTAGSVTHPRSGEQLEEERQRRLLVHRGQHLQFAANPAALGDLILAYLLARIAGHAYAFIHGCSRNTLREGAARGAVFASVPGDSSASWKLFDLNKKEVKCSTLALARPVRYLLPPSNAAGAGAERVRQAATLAPHLFEGELLDPAAALRASFHAIWSAFGFDARVGLVVLDSDFSSQIAARLVCSPQSALHSLWGQPGAAAALVAKRDALVAGAQPFLASQTDFYWGIREARLRPLRQMETTLAEEGSPVRDVALAVESDPETLARELRVGRRLTPDLILSFLCEAVIPDALVTGGVSQMEYFGTVQQVAANLQPAGPTGAALSPGGETALLHGLLEPSDPLTALAAYWRRDPDGAAQRTLERSLRASAPSLAAHAYLVGMAATSRSVEQ